MIFRLALFILLLACPAWGAVTFDAATTVIGEATSVNVAHATADQPNRVALACVVVTLNETITGVTYNSVSFGSALLTLNNSDQIRVALYKLVAPATGSNTFEVTVSGSAPIAAAIMTFNGVDQTTPLGTAVGDGDGGPADTSASVDVGSAVDDLVASCFGLRERDFGPTNGGSETERFFGEYSGVGSGPYFNGTTKAGGSPTVTMSRDWSGDSSSYFGLIGVSIKPASAAPTRQRVIFIQ